MNVLSVSNQYIQLYLNTEYKLDHPVFLQISKNTSISAKNISENIVEIFDIDQRDADHIVYMWAYNMGAQDIMGNWDNWMHDSVIERYRYAQLLGTDLVSVQPMTEPSGQLFHLDYSYDAPTTITGETRNFTMGHDPIAPTMTRITGSTSTPSVDPDAIHQSWLNSGLFANL